MSLRVQILKLQISIQLWSSTEGCVEEWAVCRGSIGGFSLKATLHGPIMGKLISLVIVMDESAVVPQAASVWAWHTQHALWLFIIIRLPAANFLYTSFTFFNHTFPYSCVNFSPFTCPSCPGSWLKYKGKHGNINHSESFLLGEMMKPQMRQNELLQR